MIHWRCDVCSLAPNDQNFVQASGSQQLVFPYGSNAIPRPSAMNPQNNWIHAQQSDRTPHLSQPIGMPPGTMSYSNPTTMVNVYTVPSGLSRSIFPLALSCQRLSERAVKLSQPRSDKTTTNTNRYRNSTWLNLCFFYFFVQLSHWILTLEEHQIFTSEKHKQKARWYSLSMARNYLMNPEKVKNVWIVREFELTYWREGPYR